MYAGGGQVLHATTVLLLRLVFMIAPVRRFVAVHSSCCLGHRAVKASLLRLVLHYCGWSCRYVLLVKKQVTSR